MPNLILKPSDPHYAAFAPALREMFGESGLQIDDLSRSEDGELSTITGKMNLLGASTACTLVLEKHNEVYAAFCLTASLSSRPDAAAKLWPQAKAGDMLLTDTRYVATSGWGRTDGTPSGVNVPVGSGVSLLGSTTLPEGWSGKLPVLSNDNFPFPKLGKSPGNPVSTVVRRTGAGLHVDHWWKIFTPVESTQNGMKLRPTWYGFRNWVPDAVGQEIDWSWIYGITVGGHEVPVCISDDFGFEVDEWVRLRFADVTTSLASSLPAGWDADPQLVEAIQSVGSSVAGELYNFGYWPSGRARLRVRLYPGASKSWSLGFLGLELDSVVVGLTCRAKRFGDLSYDATLVHAEDNPTGRKVVTDDAPTGDYLAIDVTAAMEMHGAPFRLRWDGTSRTASMEMTDPQKVDVGGFLSSLVGANLPFGLDSLRLHKGEIFYVAETDTLLTNVGLEGAVVLIPDLVHLTMIGFEARKFPSLGLKFGVYGAIQVGGATLTCSGEPQDDGGWLLAASLQDASGINVTQFLTTLVQKVGLSLPGSLPSVVINSMDASYETAAKTISLGAQFAINSIGWNVRVNRGGDKSWNVLAEMARGAITFHPDELAKALHSLLPSSGATQAAPPVPGQLFEKLLPKEIKIKAAQLGFDLGQRSATAYAEVDVTFGISTTALKLSVNHPGAGLGWAFSGEMDFDPAHLPNLADVPAKLGFGDASALGDLGTFLKAIEVQWLSLSFNTLTKAKQAVVDVKYKESTEMRFTFSEADGVTDLWGHAEANGGRLDLQLHKPKGGTFAVIFAFDGGASGGLSPTDLIQSLLGSDAPDTGSLKLRRGGVVTWKNASAVREYCLMADLDVGLDLSGMKSLPVLGEHLPDHLSVGAAVHLAYVSEILPTDLGDVVGGLLPEGFTLPAQPGSGDTKITVRLGDQSFQLGQPVSGAATINSVQLTVQGSAPPNPAPASLQQPVTWLEVEKSLGPIHLRRVGAGADAKALHFRVDGGVTFAGLTVGLEGLGVDYKWSDKSVTPTLSGIDLGLVRGPVEIAASFGKSGNDYVGTGFLHTAKFGLTVVGAVGEVGGALSLFIFGVLDMPLGGPPFLFVDGLAVGFGLNRHLAPPDVFTLDNFALLQVAKGECAIDGLAGKMESQISPSLGEYFFAVGFKFTSFKMINGVVLALAEIDAVRSSFRLDVLASAEWSSPPGLKCDDPSAVAWVELNIVGSIIPDEGAFIVHAELSPKSFALDRNCHLHGGFAAACWAAGPHAGDFVISLGGYHPAFHVPSHYPVPSRIGADWLLGPLTVKGSLYFAVTPHALMCGVSLHADWNAGPFSAWFDFGVDFLMEFKPLHYEGDLHIEIGASVSLGFLGHITISAGADLHISGPDFSGHGTVSVCSFHVPLSFGPAPAPPPGLTWNQVATELLSCKLNGDAAVLDSLLSCTAVSGLRGNNGDRWIVNPHTFELAIESGVPCAKVSFNGTNVETTQTEVVVSPMFPAGNGPNWSGAEITLTITRDGGKLSSDSLVLTERTRPYPRAIFQTSDPNARLAQMSGGVTLSPKEPRPGGSRSFDPSLLTEPGDGKADPAQTVQRLWSPPSSSTASSLASWGDLDETLKVTRQRLCDALGGGSSTRLREVGQMGGSLLDVPNAGQMSLSMEVKK